MILLEGIAAGCILSLTLFPGTVWVAKVGVCGSARQVLAVSSGFALSNLIWMCVAVAGLRVMLTNLHPIRPLMYLFAAGNLGYLAYKFLRTPKAVSLSDASELPSAGVLFQNAFVRSLAMPMRLPLAMSLVLAAMVFVNHPQSYETVAWAIVGGLVGIIYWWGQLAFLAGLFAKKVPEEVTLKSINKIRPFGVVLFVLLAIIAALLAAK